MVWWGLALRRWLVGAVVYSGDCIDTLHVSIHANLCGHRVNHQCHHRITQPQIGRISQSSTRQHLTPLRPHRDSPTRTTGRRTVRRSLIPRGQPQTKPIQRPNNPATHRPHKPSKCRAAGRAHPLPNITLPSPDISKPNAPNSPKAFQYRPELNQIIVFLYNLRLLLRVRRPAAQGITQGPRHSVHLTRLHENDTKINVCFVSNTIYIIQILTLHLCL